MYQDYLKRKEKIIISAIEILDEAGIQGLTIKEIAKRQGVTEPAIYRHFKNKQEIILAIIERFALFDDVIMNTIVEQKMDERQGILYFVDSFASYYQSYPQITTVMFSFDLFRYQSTVNEKVMEIINKRYLFITKLIDVGIKQKRLKDTVNAEELSHIILGTILSCVYTWKMSNCKTDLKEVLIRKIKWLLCQVINR